MTQINNGDKLYIVSREDLSAGMIAVQGMHVAIQFVMEHEIAREWYEKSNYLCFLAAKDENHLKELIDKAREKNIPISIFREDDLNNEITAIALAPCRESKKLCQPLKLALKPKIYHYD